MNLFTERCELTFLTLIISFLFMLPAAADEPLISVETFDFGNTINDLCISGHKVLCATDCGIVAWDRTSLSYENMSVVSGADAGRWPDIAYITANSHEQIMAVNIGSHLVYLFDGQEWTQHRTGIFSELHHGLFTDLSGDFWGGTGSSGLYTWDGADSTVFSANNGIINVRDIAIDDNGGLWFGTKTGIVGLIGDHEYRFTVEDGLPIETVSCICYDNGIIWAGTRKGLVRLENGVVKIVTSSDGLVDDNVNDIVADHSGNIWVATINGVSRFNGQFWESFTDTNELMDNNVTSMAVDSNNRVWFCSKTDNKGITVYEKGEFVWYTRYDDSVPTQKINVVAGNGIDDIWIGWDGGIARMKEGSWITYDISDGIAGNNIQRIWPGPDGSVWVRTDDSLTLGVSRFSDGIWQTYSIHEGLYNNCPDYIYEAVDGTVLYCHSDCIIKVEDGIIDENTIQNHLLSSTVLDIDQNPDGALWIGTGYGLTRFDGENWKTITYRNGLPSNRIDDIEVASDGSLWFLYDGKHLAHYDGETFKSPEDPNGGGTATFSSLEIAKNGMLWAIKGYDRLNYSQTETAAFDFPQEESGLYSYDGISWTFHPFPDNERFRYVTLRKAVADDDNIIWCATDSGLARFDGETWSLHTVKGPVNSSVYDMAVDKKNVKWFATRGGISSYDDGEWQHYPIRAWNNPEPLYRNNLITFKKVLADPVSDNMWFVPAYPIEDLWSFQNGQFKCHKIDSFSNEYVIDHDGLLWKRTQSGIVSYDGHNTTYYTVDNGLSPELIPYCEVYIDRSNTKWFISNMGMTRFDGSSFTHYKTSRPTYPFDIVSDSTGKLWFINSQSGVYLFDPTAEDCDLSAELNVSGNLYYSISILSDDTVCVSHSGGVSMNDGSRWEFTLEESRFSEWPPYFHTDVYGRLWLIGHGYSAVYDGVDWQRFENIPMSLGASVNDMDGSIWMEDYYGLRKISLTDETKPVTVPNTLLLHGNSPNPFNAGTMIEFDLENMNMVTLSIYNMLGQKVYELAPTLKPVGRNAILWNGRDNDGVKVSSGVYFYRVKAGGKSADGRMMFLK